MSTDDLFEPLVSTDPRRRRINLDDRIHTSDNQNMSQQQVPLDLEGCSGSWFCHPYSLGHRLIALTLMCLFGFGSYFCFDNPGALQREIKDAMDINTYQFASLYAWYSWPNVILPIIGGYLMDNVFGIRLGTIIFAFIIVIGQIMFAMGGFFYNYWLMQIGRFVFGIGGESLAVAQNTYAVAWFKGKELNMVFGFQLSIARLGSTVNFLVVGPLYAQFAQHYTPSTAVGWTLLIAGSTCVMSFVCAVALGYMDKRVERLLNKDTTKTGEVVRLTDVFSFPLTFWILSIVCLAYYGAIFPFISLGQVFFIKKFGMAAKEANFITGLIYLISAPASPLLGFLIDKTGRNVLYVFLAIVFTLLGHTLLGYSFMNPYFAVVMMGMAYSLLASALWPIAALIIEEHKLGTAYGFMQAIQNLGMALITMLTGHIVDHNGYVWSETLFIFWLCVALLGTILIWLIDYTGSGYLNMGIAQREVYEKELNRRKKAEEEARMDREEYVEALRPRTEEQLRQLYLLRIGAALPPHLGHSGLNVVTPSRGQRPDQRPTEGQDI